MEHNQQLKYAHLLIPIFVIITGLLVTACGGEQNKTYTIGVASEPNLGVVLDGFKAGMTELGYVEGKNVTYIYHGELRTDPQVNEAEIKSLMGQKVGLLLTLGNMPSVAAKNAVEGTDTPVVFAPILNPVGAGIVASISHPGGNLTGVQAVSTTPKALEWLLTIAPGTKKVYVPYNPADQIALASTKSLPDVAAKLGVELVLDEVSSGEEELAGIRALPKDSAILFVISPSLNSNLEDASKLAIELRIPTGSSNSAALDKMLFTYSTDLPGTGKQAAALVDKIFKGTKPGDLPVETTEFPLTISLKIAEAIGLDIPDTILRQADTVIR